MPRWLREIQAKKKKKILEQYECQWPTYPLLSVFYKKRILANKESFTLSKVILIWPLTFLSFLLDFVSELFQFSG